MLNIFIYFFKENFISILMKKYKKKLKFLIKLLGMGDWGWGIGDWGLGPIPNPQSPNYFSVIN